MLVRVFTLPFDPATERFNDDVVREFLADKDVTSIHDHFFVKDATPYLILVACYRPRAPLLLTAPEAKGGRRRDESWREVLSKEDWPLFNTLRDWHAERARGEGIPTYVICNKLALDIAEDLVEARYRRGKQAILHRVNLRLEKLRVLLRLCHRLRYLSHAGYEHAARSIDEVGRMLGGWIKDQQGKAP